MRCPRCQSEEIGASGLCLVCGHIITKGHGHDSQDPSLGEELPRWRQELSERLSALKQNRETADISEPSEIEIPAPPTEEVLKSAAGPPEAQQTLLDHRTHRSRSTYSSSRSSEKPRTSGPQQKTLAPSRPEVFPVKPEPKFADRQEVSSLIDSVVSGQSVHADMNAPTSVQEPPRDDDGKLILLSRTLSGLIDLIFIVLCTGVFIISADYFSGIVVLDFASLVDYALLFLLTYFLYSLFFLAASNQTIGMMITDLRVLGIDEQRPSMVQLFSRCSGYLLSVLGLGIGLLWSLFDRDSLCFHDRLSRTHIIRI